MGVESAASSSSTMGGGGASEVHRAMVANRITPDPRTMFDRLPEARVPDPFPEEEVAVVDDPAALLKQMEAHSLGMLERLRLNFKPDFDGMAELRERVKKAAAGLRPYAASVGLEGKGGFALPDGDPPGWTPEDSSLEGGGREDSSSPPPSPPLTMLWRGDSIDRSGGTSSPRTRAPEQNKPFPSGRARPGAPIEGACLSLYEGLPLGMDGRVLIREIAERLEQSNHMNLVCTKVPIQTWVSWFDADNIQEIFVDFFWLALNTLLLGRADITDQPPLFSAEELLDNIAHNYLNLVVEVVSNADKSDTRNIHGALFFYAMPFVFACAIHRGFANATPAESRTLKHIMMSESIRRGVCDTTFHWCSGVHPPQQLWKIMQELRNPAVVLAEQLYEDLIAGKIHPIALQRVKRKADAELLTKRRQREETLDGGNSVTSFSGESKSLEPTTSTPSMSELLTAMHKKGKGGKDGQVSVESSSAVVPWTVKLGERTIGNDGITRLRFYPLHQSPLLKRSMDIHGLKFQSTSPDFVINLLTTPVEHGISEEEAVAIRARSVLLGLDEGAERHEVENLEYKELSSLFTREMKEMVQKFHRARRHGTPAVREERKAVHEALDTVKSERIRILSDDMFERYFDRELVNTLSNRLSGWDVRLAEIKTDEELEARANVERGSSKA